MEHEKLPFEEKEEVETALMAPVLAPLNPVQSRRKVSKKKKHRANRHAFEVKVIPATAGVVAPGEIAPKRRVAAYCRVSTDDEAQASSYSLQVEHYTEYISHHENWVLIKIYADEGISGTQVKHRENFLQMIEDCQAGQIDMVLTKSISRFARNVVDCLTYLRELKNHNPPIEVYFEKERLSSLDDKTDMVLSLMASIAQEESRSISANIRWATKNRMKNGTQAVPTCGLLGYDTNEEGEMVIIESEAEVVRMMYKSFVQGIHPSLIATRLNSIGRKTVYGNDWTGPAVRGILQNEKYCGDVMMQKTVTVDYLTHKSKKNEGEAEKFYVSNHHDPIVSRELWDKAQAILEKTSWKNWKKRKQIRLAAVTKGRLRGFVPISPEWREMSIKRLESASVKAGIEDEHHPNEFKKDVFEESEQIIMSENSILAGFEVVELNQTKSDSVLTVSASSMKFNKATAEELGYPAYVRVLLNASVKKVAIQSCTEKTPNAINFSQERDQQKYSIILKVPALQMAVRKMMPEIADAANISATGEIFVEERTIIYDMANGKMAKRKNGRGKIAKEDNASEAKMESGSAEARDEE